MFEISLSVSHVLECAPVRMCHLLPRYQVHPNSKSQAQVYWPVHARAVNLKPMSPETKGTA